MRYRDRIFDDRRHDPYQARHRYAEPSVCEGCGVVMHHGHWAWGTAPAGAATVRCPACLRIADGLAAGTLVLDGVFFSEHRADILGLVENVAKREREEHPLHRTMRIEDRGHQTVIETTDIHLPQRIGEALKSAYHGTLELHYAKDEYQVRAHWHR